MNAAELELAAAMLAQMAEHYGNHGCNDWQWPPEWRLKQRERFLDLMGAADGEWDYPVDNFGPPDWMVLETLARLLRAEAKAADVG
jgi:hypothetical protein